MLLALMFLLAQQQAQEQQPPQQQPPSDAELQKELEQAIKADQQGAQKKGQAEQPSQPAPETAVSGTSGPARPSSAPQTSRGTQSLNPDISVILDGDMGWQRRAPQFLNGDDPDLHGDIAHALGFTAQEVELAASAIVDPFFRGDVFLTIPNLEGIEVEEAFITTTSLPWNLQVKGGSFRGAFGRQNGQHLHVQDFTRRPLINAAFLGADGMRGPGLQVSWLAPLPFFLTLYGEAFSLRSDPVSTGGPVPEPVPSFGSDGAQRPTLAGEAKLFFPFGEEWSLFGGLNVASGESPGIAVAPGFIVGAGRQTQLFGADMYLKWKPANVAGGYTSVAFQAETVFRHLAEGGGLPSDWDGGAYAQVVVQFARQWFLGVRGDLIGLPEGQLTRRTARGAVSLTWQASEFARVRGYAELEKGNISEDVGSSPGPALLPAVSPSWAPAAFVQVEFSIGAHGAHPF
jgi:hypothetical protein